MPNPICPTGTTYVPEGRFKGGTKVKGMCIDTKPVLHKSYYKSLFSGSPVRKNKSVSLTRRGLTPVIYVSFNDAKKYCQSRGMRLPTHEEWVWAFMKSRHSLSMGMKSRSGKTLPEFIECRYIGPFRFASIVGSPPIDSRGCYFYLNYWNPSPFGLKRMVPTTFRCAVEPSTFWKNWIIGLLVDPLLIGARFLGLKDPRTTR